MRQYGTCCLASVVLSVLLLCACGGPESGQNNPAPGTMEVVSITPVLDALEHRSVLPNGTFEEWWAGAPAPSGFFAPFPNLSVIKRVTDEREKGFAVRQTWRAPDEREPISRRFCTEVALKPDTQYVFQVAATNNNVKRPPRITVVERMPQEGYEGLANPLLTLEDYPGLFRWYQETFRTKTGMNVTILSHTQSMDANDTPDVTWHAWRLFEWQGEPPELPVESERPTLYGISNPKEAPNNTITLAAGEALSMNGWIVGGEDAVVRYRLNDGEFREPTLLPRSDVKAKYPEAPVCTGWEITVPADELGELNSLVLQFGEKDPVEFTVKRTG